MALLRIGGKGFFLPCRAGGGAVASWFCYAYLLTGCMIAVGESRPVLAQEWTTEQQCRLPSEMDKFELICASVCCDWARHPTDVEEPEISWGV